MRICRAFFSLSLAFFYAHVFCYSKPQNNFLAFGKRFLYWQTNMILSYTKMGTALVATLFSCTLKLELKLAKRSFFFNISIS